ncbi:fmr1 neighbor protein isoform 3 [Mus musculus]|uniref:Fmr1 neighbor n=1 Tax=Mus musculus TaxID=10090 RepID=B7ZW84_MOUSE|nr:fmr1 neighbor protein isoform 3 [Mus musculus]AAI71922.1 Fmr1nb protein [Mus musculus]|eukprot:NP_001160092.1 fragile X mental retardation 1 neighbor protein isoform 3 [Mus musculus]
MPSDRRPSQRRNRSKSRDYRGARSKVTRADTRNRDDTLALSMYQGPPSADQGNNMADAPRFGFWTSVSQCLQYLWARRHLGLLLLLFWTLVILFRPVNTEPTQVLRVFGLAAISILVLGFLPMCCCSMCWRRKRMNRMLKVLKKQKSKGKKPKGRKASEERALLSH